MPVTPECERRVGPIDRGQSFACLANSVNFDAKRVTRSVVRRESRENTHWKTPDPLTLFILCLWIISMAVCVRKTGLIDRFSFAVLHVYVCVCICARPLYRAVVCCVILLKISMNFPKPDGFSSLSWGFGFVLLVCRLLSCCLVPALALVFW